VYRGPPTDFCGSAMRDAATGRRRRLYGAARKVECVLPLIRLAAVLTGTVMLVSSCTEGPPPQGQAGASSTPPTPATSAPAELTPRERVSQLTALAPESFDARYRLDSRGKRRDAKIRMRVKGDKFRLDVEEHRTTAVLFTSPRGIVSCQVERSKKGKITGRSCFLVAKSAEGIPKLFDPQVHQLFRNVTTQLSHYRNDLTVRPTDSWHAPAPLGRAECFQARGPKIDPGTYCYLAEPGPRIGLLAHVEFPSGELSIRKVYRSVHIDNFHPPVRPTPLPN